MRRRRAAPRAPGAAALRLLLAGAAPCLLLLSGGHHTAVGFVPEADAPLRALGAARAPAARPAPPSVARRRPRGAAGVVRRAEPQAAAEKEDGLKVPKVTFSYRAVTKIMLRKEPDVGSEKLGAIAPGSVFEVVEEVEGSDGQRYLKLANRPGWAFTQGVAGEWLGKPIVERAVDADASRLGDQLSRLADQATTEFMREPIMYSLIGLTLLTIYSTWRAVFYRPFSDIFP